MRYAGLVLVAALLPLTGCAAIINASGTDLEKLKTREEVHEKFGPPTTTGVENEHTYEEFHTRRKISGRMYGEGYIMADVATLGLAELYMFPAELVKLTRDTIAGSTIRIRYDAEGNVLNPALLPVKRDTAAEAGRAAP